MRVYTLPVIDDDGDVTGNPGALLVASRTLETVPFEDAEIGQAVLPEDFPFLVSDQTQNVYTPDNREWRPVTVTLQPNPRGELRRDEADVLTVWERVR